MANKAAVLGHPVAHSLSPKLHGYWLKEYGIAGSYAAIDTPPEKLSETLSRLQAEGYAGVNLTVPLKEKALPLLDAIDPPAGRIGAVNTVVFREGRKEGYNTDAYGFMQNIGNRAFQKAVVLGAGGAARAVVAGLLEAGTKQIILCNRNFQKAEKLAEDFSLNPESRIPNPHPWETRHAALAQADLLVNATSLGMQGQPALEISLAVLPSSALVTDIVYKPLETPLLREARWRGNPVIDGLGMLLYQGQKAFELFFGILPEVNDGVRDYVLK